MRKTLARAASSLAALLIAAGPAAAWPSYTGGPSGSARPSPASGVGVVATQAPASTAALASSLVVSAAPASLASFEVQADATLSAAAWYVMLYDATAAPADGAVTPLKCYTVASGSASFAAAFIAPIPFTTGVVIGVSTSGCFTKTASAHAFISGEVQ